MTRLEADKYFEERKKQLLLQAQKRANEAFPDIRLFTDFGFVYSHQKEREAYIKGYLQHNEDLILTEEKIDKLVEELKTM